MRTQTLDKKTPRLKAFEMRSLESSRKRLYATVSVNDNPPKVGNDLVTGLATRSKKR